MTNWDGIRQSKSAESAPREWPPGVQPISIDGLGLIGINVTTNQIYWDGQPLVTEKRLNNFERGMALSVTIATVIVAAIEVGRAAGWIAN